MARLELLTDIAAPPAVCFDLARGLDLHRRSMAASQEEVIAGRVTGRIQLGEEVTFRARHFGLVHHHTAKITAFDPPRHFRDEMVSGRFAQFIHDHHFEATPAGTRMRDVLVFRSPLGPLAALADETLLKPYLRRLLTARNSFLRRMAEERGEAQAPSEGAALAPGQERIVPWPGKNAVS